MADTKPDVDVRRLPSGQDVVIYRDESGVTHVVGPMPTMDAMSLARLLKNFIEGE